MSDSHASLFQGETNKIRSPPLRPSSETETLKLHRSVLLLELYFRFFVADFLLDHHVLIDIPDSSSTVCDVVADDEQQQPLGMSQDQASSSQNAPSTWTEPPWSGWIETTGDALLILEAARRGLIPRVTRRLVDSERKMITSGSVFVFDEDESGIKRWTDGFFWSPSRILGNFLLYRETEKRGAGHRSARAERETNEEYVPDGVKTEAGQSLSRPKSEANRLGIDRQRERTLVGSLTNSYKFKPGGLMKKVSFDSHPTFVAIDSGDVRGDSQAAPRAYVLSSRLACLWSQHSCQTSVDYPGSFAHPARPLDIVC